MKGVFLTATALVTASLISDTAFAQTDSDAPHPAVGEVKSNDQAGLADIVVTAQRRAENLQKVPLAVTAVTGASLADAGVTRAQDLAALVPALAVSSSAGPYNTFYIRGVGSLNGNALSDSAIAFNYDGVYVSRASSTAGFFYDIDRVEVLKGPQGTIYGRNATGGAINVLPVRPIIGDTSASIGLDYGNYDALTISGNLNLALGDRTAARLSFQTSDHDGYMSDGTDDQKGRAVRLQLLSNIADNLKVRLAADYFHQGGKGAGSTLLPYRSAEKRIGLNDPEVGAVYAATILFSAGNFFAPLDAPVHLDNDYYGINATVDLTTSLGTLTVIPAYRRGELDFLSTTPAFAIRQRETDEQASLEMRFASSQDQTLRYLVGAYYLHESVKSVAFYNASFNLNRQDLSSPLDSYAAFGRLTYAFSDRLRLTGGARYTIDRKRLEGRSDSANILCPAVLAAPASFPAVNCFGGPTFPVAAAIPPEAATAAATGIPQPYGTRGNIVEANTIFIDRSQTFKKFTWRAAAEFDFAHRSMMYASVEKGFKAGGLFFTNDKPTYRPEGITAYTIGSKNRLFDNRLQLNAELFLWKYADQQISHIELDSLGSIVLATENVGRMLSKGFELNAEFLASPSTTFSADVQYLHSRYNDFIYEVPNLGGPSVAACPASLSGRNYRLDCSGKTPPFAPRWTLNLGLQQRFELSDRGRITASGHVHYQTSTLTGLEFLEAEIQPAYWMGNASIDWSSADDRFSIGAYIRNITNETVIGNSFPNPLAGANLLAGTLQPPRTYGIRVGAKF